eukprot:SAG11_NODE_13589_length_648_cov_1.786885_1_plen_63_part_01
MPWDLAGKETRDMYFGSCVMRHDACLESCELFSMSTWMAEPIDCGQRGNCQPRDDGFAGICTC